MLMFIEKKTVKLISIVWSVIGLFLTTLKSKTPEKKTEKSDRPIFSFGTVQLASKFMVIINASNKACGFH